MTRAVVLVALLSLLSLGFEWEGRLARLTRELETAEAAQRRALVERLASYPAAEVAEPLLTALDDDDPGVRAAAARAVGQVRLTEAVPRLLDWLDDADPDVRAAAARALGRIGDRQAIPNLVRILGDNHAAVRRAGVQALGGLRGPDVVVPMLGRLDDDDPGVRVEAAQMLAGLGDRRAVVPLVGRARDGAPEVRTAVYAALGELGDPRAVPALVQGTRDDAPEPRLAAVAALGQVGSEEAVRPLRALLAGPNPRLASAVTAALGQIPGPAAADALVEALGQPRTQQAVATVLRARAQRLARTGRSEPLDALVTSLGVVLDEARGQIHASAVASTLHEIGAIRTIAPAAEPLLRALEEHRGDAWTVLRALGRTGDTRVLLPLLERLDDQRAEVRAAVLAALGDYFDRAAPDGRVADPLLASLGQVEPGERELVVTLLGRVGAERALPALRALLGHESGPLRLAAIRAIGEIGDTAGAAPLLALLDDPLPQLRFEAARALGRSASAETTAVLLARLEAREPVDRHALLVALGSALRRAEGLDDGGTDEAWRVLLSLAGGPDEQLAARAIDAIGTWAPAGGDTRLAPLLARATGDRATALIAALAQMPGDTGRGALRDVLEHARSTARRTQAAWALAEVATREDGQRLLALASELPWPASAAAAFGLGRLVQRGVLSGRPVRDALCQLGGRSHDPFVRANVALGLARLGTGSCPGGPDPLHWLEDPHAGVVRAAAARWAQAAADAGELDRRRVQDALARCAAEPLAPAVATACARPQLPADASDEADVYAYAPDGESLWRSRLVALRLADGSVFLGHTDDNGHLRLRRVPAGALVLEDPSATPLEP